MSTLAELLIKVSADAAGVARGMADINRSVGSAMASVGTKISSAGAAMERTGAQMSATGATLSRSVTLPLVAVGGAAFKMASDFEASMAKIVGLVGVPREQVQAWEADVRQLAITYGSSATQAADALFFITSAGLKGSDAMDALEASLKASAVGLGDVTTIADLTTSAMNAYKTENLSAAEATDVLAATVREGKLEAADLAGAMGRVFPVASAMGVGIDEVGAALAAMSRTGTNAAEGTTQLRGILSAMLKPTREAEEQLDKLGLSAEGLRKQIREEGLLATMETLTTAFDGNEAATAAVFGNVRALSGVMDMMGANADDTRAIFGALADSTGSLDRAFAETSDTARFQMQQSLAEVKDLLLEVGQAVMPVVIDVMKQGAGIVRDLAERWKSLSPETQKFIVQAALIVAAVGPVLLIVGKVITILGTLVRSVGLVIQILGFLWSLLLAHPFVLIAAAIVALVVVVVKNWDTIKEAITKAWNVIKDVTGKVWEFIKDAVGTAVDFLVGLFLNFTVPGLIVKHWDTIKNATSKAWNAIKDAVSAAINAVKSAVTSVWNAISSFVSGVVNKIKSFVVNGFNSLRSGATTALQRLKSGATNLLNSLLSFVRNIPSRIVSFFTSLPGRLYDVGKRIMQGLINGIKSMFGAIGNAVSGAVSKITNLWPFSPAKEGPLRRFPPEIAGENIGRLFAGGLADAEREVVRAAESIARAAALDASSILPEPGRGLDVARAAIAGTTAPAVVAAPPSREQRIVWDVTGADEDLKRMIRRMARTSGLDFGDED